MWVTDRLVLSSLMLNPWSIVKLSPSRWRINTYVPGTQKRSQKPGLYIHLYTFQNLDSWINCNTCVLFSVGVAGLHLQLLPRSLVAGRSPAGTDGSPEPLLYCTVLYCTTNQAKTGSQICSSTEISDRYHLRPCSLTVPKSLTD